MHLRNLRIQGFKSFGEKTELEFSPGITGIVGPNGCGKSNVSDAVLWALGEQNLRRVRGNVTSDIIFAGSRDKKPLNFAEVTLEFDNHSSSLRIDSSAVTITRRAYRTGDSEFYINKTPCRLKDIYELFLDTGLGKDAYSIISQGEVDRVLSVRPEERRELLEEAAGIKKYRFRKQETLRRLDQVERNLTRVQDILDAIRPDIEPLRLQAEIAERYNAILAELKGSEKLFLFSERQRLTIDIASKQGQLRTAEYELEAAKESQRKAAERRRDLRSMLAETERELQHARESHSNAQRELDRAESRRAVLQIRQGNLDTEKSRLKRETDTTRLELAELETRLRSLEAEIQMAVGREAEIAKQVTLLLSQREGLERRLAEAEEIARLFGSQEAAELAELRASLGEKIGALSALESEKAKLDARLQNLLAEEQETTEAVRRLKEELQGCQQDLERQDSRFAEIKAQKTAANNRHQEALEILEAVRSHISRMESRLNALQEMAESFDGYGQGPKSVLQAQSSGKLRGNYRAVADIFEVPAEYMKAIESALGAALQNIVCETDEEAQQAIRHLRESRTGRATFLPLTLLRARARHLQRPDLWGFPGLVGEAKEIVKYDPQYEPVAELLLGRVFIFERFDEAVAVVKSVSGWVKLVTSQGELFFPSGAVAGGERRQTEDPILGRRREIEQLAAQLQELRAEKMRAEQELADRRVQLQLISEEAAHAEQLRAQITAQTNELGTLMHSLEATLARSSEERRHLESQTAEMGAALSELAAACATMREREQNLSGLTHSPGRESDGADSVERLKTELEEINEQLQRLALERERLVSGADASRQRVGEAKSQISRLREMEAQLSEAVWGLAAQSEALAEDLKLVEAAAKIATEQLEQCRASLAELTEERTTLTDEVDRIELEEQARAEAIEQLISTREATAAKINSLEQQLRVVEERIAEEYGQSTEVHTSENLTGELTEFLSGRELDQLRSKIRKLQTELRAMGIVNLGAIEEYARLSEREKHLTQEMQDLQETEVSLRQAMEELDHETKGAFMAVFDAVGAAFNKNFCELFGGGDTRLALTMPDNLLETGVDIHAQIPGKKMTNLQSMSGGERALTATAFLFALLAVRPSPFVLIDELDAPLDDANVHRFVKMLKKYAEKSQFLVITHNKQTMEAADALYGVTMEQPGLSKILSVRLKKETAAALVSAERHVE